MPFVEVLEQVYYNTPREWAVPKAENIANELAQLDAIFTAAEKMLDVGLAGTSSAAIDQLVADLNRAGLQKVKTEYQRQIDAFRASKK